MRKKPTAPQRIEPTFDAPKRSARDGMRVSPEDRAVVSQSQPRRKGTPTRKKKAASRKNRRGGLFGALSRLTYWCFVFAIWGGIAAACVVGYYAAKLPQTTSWTVPSRPPNARIVATNGELIANRGTTGGAVARIDEMSPYIPMAVIAIEDRRYKHHFGFDPIGFTRAMATNAMRGRLVQGGSTLTQQLAKNLFLEPERTIERKIQELVLALWLETKFTKDEILELYLNRVYFGSGAYGVDAAARRYFDKSARDVNLAEAALLAGLLKAPSKLSPARNPKLAEERAQLVLAAMKREAFITEREAKTAIEMPAKKAKRFWSGSEHYVADLVMKELPALIGEMREDVIVDTTINLEWQKLAGSIITETIEKQGAKRKVSQGAMVSMTPEGAIRALVGGVEYADSQYNRASDARRQPGSAFKPIVYLAALEAGRTPQSVRNDAKVKIGKWTPENYDRKYRGRVTLDTALAKSLNTVAAQLVMEVGPETVVQTAHRLGIRSELTANASIALGTSEVSLLELTGAYAPFANGGYEVTPYLIRQVKDLSGKVLYKRETPAARQVVRARELGMMNSMLSHVISKGTGTAAALENRDAAGKTGTTQNSRDGLFVGYTANLVTGFWYGNDDGSPTNKVTGGSLPARNWQKFMTSALSGLPNAQLPGNYIPETPAVPTPKKNLNGNLVSQAERPADRTGRKSLSQINREDGIRPQGEVGGNRQARPKTILDLIFGG